MKKMILILVLLTIPSLHSAALCAQKWVVEPSIPDYSKRGMEAGSIGNPYEASIRPNGRIEINSTFQDPGRPIMAPGQPLNPYEIRPVR
jgi:hypothetical protein